MSPIPDEPLILTLRMDPSAFSRFQSERQRFYPAHLNRIPAHISLFHHLPGAEINAVADACERICRKMPAFPIRASSLRSLGRGFAYTLVSGELLTLRHHLRQEFLPWLTQQDLQNFQPHVTIQNKVLPEDAKRTLRTLQEQFKPFLFHGTGVCLWHYRGGPWEFARDFLFAEKNS